jgi:orotate phosphoribosyltransferase
MHGELTHKLFTMAKDKIYKYRAEPFLLASGAKSNHYFNCKEITLDPALLSLLAKAMRDELIPSIKGSESPESIGGLTMGADPICYALSLSFLEQGKTVLPLIVRKEAKDHGTGKKIEGKFDSVKSCLVIDDVITTGGSTLKAVQALRDAGLTVTSGICILDREEGGRENLAKEGVTMFSLWKKSEFF